ncbi:MAG TPA: FGGY family carbohydrate kinase, partial [Kribbella sp.]|nr:FGGY family carbohydrate kinase [Kribbella sp.]
MAEQYVAAVDQGTNSTRCILFDRRGRLVSVAQREHPQLFPRPGWVEHDAGAIWNNVTRVVPAAIRQIGAVPSQIVAIGIANQRETSLLWDRFTGQPIGHAVVWQDTRTDRLVTELAGDEGPDRFADLCGLPLTTYFSAPRIRWMLDHTPGLRQRAERGEIVFGTMESWLIWNFTGGASGGLHVTDVTNASRTMLMNIETLEWDDRLLEAFAVPRAILPEIRPSSGVFATATEVLPGVRIGAALGDQQAALFGQTCFSAGEAKCTYGTGSFLLLHTGQEIVRS